MLIKAILFDIGNTLGTVHLDSKTLAPFDDMLDLLKTAGRVFRVPLGVITNIPDDWNKTDVENLLRGAGILDHLDVRGIITSVDAKGSKPEKRIYEYAAQQLDVKTSECLFIDDELRNVLGASAAGMSAIQKVAP
jgi:FMN phosphatase YigB (HAD superfamily)